MQLHRSSYRCATCGGKAQAKPGSELYCVKCLKDALASVRDFPAIGEQMLLFSFDRLADAAVMVETKPLVLVLSKRVSA